jgi:hypothetical protein
MATSSESLRHRLGDVFFLLGAGYFGLIAVGGPLAFPYDVVAAAGSLGLGVWIGDYKTRWWPAARYTDRHHEVRTGGDPSQK